jgi:uncharacterized repeat protein (TIGR01451 family)
VTVTKALADGSQPAGDTTFPITVTCNAAEYRHTFHLAVGQSGTTGELPAGTVCSVTETRPAGWEPPTFSPDATVTVPSGGNATVTVVNNRPAPPAVAGLTLVKTNNPTGAVSPGDVIAYTLTARATGNVDQADVVIADTMPVGSTYVTGSGQCVPASRTPCDVAYVETSRLLTFSVGTMSPGDEVTVTFSVRVATSAPVPGSITNVGTVTSVLAEATSNPVSNPVVAVLGEKISKPSTGLAATGPPAPIVPLLVVALALTVLGGLMAGAARRDEHRL